MPDHFFRVILLLDKMCTFVLCTKNMDHHQEHFFYVGDVLAQTCTRNMDQHEYNHCSSSPAYFELARTCITIWQKTRYLLTNLYMNSRYKQIMTMKQLYLFYSRPGDQRQGWTLSGVDFSHAQTCLEPLNWSKVTSMWKGRRMEFLPKIADHGLVAGEVDFHAAHCKNIN
mgnify:CR=1 FL=1